MKASFVSLVGFAERLYLQNNYGTFKLLFSSFLFVLEFMVLNS